MAGRRFGGWVLSVRAWSLDRQGPFLGGLPHGSQPGRVPPTPPGEHGRPLNSVEESVIVFWKVDLSACPGTGLHNCFPRRSGGKPPAITGQAAAFRCLSLLFRGGKCARFDQVSSVWGKSLSRAAPFMYFSGSPWGGERRWPSIFCSKWHL